MKPRQSGLFCIAVLCIAAGLLMKPVSMNVNNPPESSVKAQWFSVFSLTIKGQALL
ncbi:hypothetical protein [Dickeya fangzhongdai]